MMYAAEALLWLLGGWTIAYVTVLSVRGQRGRRR